LEQSLDWWSHRERTFEKKKGGQLAEKGSILSSGNEVSTNSNNDASWIADWGRGGEAKGGTDKGRGGVDESTTTFCYTGPQKGIRKKNAEGKKGGSAGLSRAAELQEHAEEAGMGKRRLPAKTWSIVWI